MQNKFFKNASKGAFHRRMGYMFQPIRSIREYIQLPAAAKAEIRHDSMGLPYTDMTAGKAIDEAMGWLCRAQDFSASQDGGVARHYSLLTGWSSSYPETTGYIVPTMLAYAKSRKNEDVRERARKMLDWLVSIQLPDGSFQGGMIDEKPVAPVAFNTGQILIGLASGAGEFGDFYRDALQRAANWLVKVQDSDGCWRKYASPFANPGEKSYDTHIAWGLLEAARVEESSDYAKAALANIRWALSMQQPNGWFDKCCLINPSRPLTHTLGYALRGIIEAYHYTKDEIFLRSALKTADGLLGALKPNGILPGRLHSDWSSAAAWSCLTGSAQIAICWLMLYEDTGSDQYRDAALTVNRFLRRTVTIEGPDETRGGVKGSFPIDGGYGSYEYLNWACKFFIDANMIEESLAGK